jgi:hypothetical protein
MVTRNPLAEGILVILFAAVLALLKRVSLFPLSCLLPLKDDFAGKAASHHLEALFEVVDRKTVGDDRANI